MPKKETVTLALKSCLDCPHHGFERDPSSHDSFDWMDDALVCNKATPSEDEVKHRILHSVPPGRIIVGCSRCAESEYEREGAKIPEWCPLRKSNRGQNLRVGA